MQAAARALWIALIGFGAFGALADPLETADAIQDCVDGNLPDLTSEQVLTLHSTDRTGSSSDARVKVFWRRFPDGYWRLLARFQAPNHVRNTALLILERETYTLMYVYLPELGRVRQITKHSLSGSLAGTDFSYEDFERVQGITRDRELERLPDSVVQERPVYVLEGRPSEGRHSSYGRVVSYVDRATCVPLLMELFSETGALRKRVVAPAAHITREPSGFVAREILVEDTLQRSRTRVVVEELEIEADVPVKLFSAKELIAGGR